MTRTIHKLRHPNRASIAGLVAAIAVIASGYFAFHSLAAGFFAANEAEQAEISGHATIVDDPTASGGKAILFGEAAANAQDTQ